MNPILKCIKFLLCPACFVFIDPAYAQTLGDTIRISQGYIAGKHSSDNKIHYFKGIPFAAPPVKDLRWKEPRPPVSWQGVRPCTRFGPSPMQGTPAPFSMWSQEFLIPKEPIDEDCLYLNVWTDAKKASEKRPVLVWIYGGGFVSGGSAVPIYDGESMARKGIVFVSINYRVGIFGFFAHPQLSKESAHGSSGNYGLMDQLAALKWVQENINAFGGDPQKVTIAGQSAGSMSVNCLVASPLAKGLFRQAIAESGALFSRPGATLKTAEEDGIKLMQKLNATSLDEIRKMPAAELVKKSAGMWRPVIDGYVLPGSIADIFAKQRENPVALLTGWNEEEGLLFGPVKNSAAFTQDMKARFGEKAKTALEFYPADNDSVAAASQLKLSRDQIFGMENYAWANIETERGRKVYVYRFTRKVPGTGEYEKYGAFHTGEVPYAYDNLQFSDRPWEPVDGKLASTMSAFWVNFISTGNPNGMGLPQWKSYSTRDKFIMDLGTQPASKPMWDWQALEFLILHAKGEL